MTALVEKGAHTVDTDNATFWDELCGTQFAQSLGITDSTPQSLKKFDDWYFALYPYLFLHIPFELMRGKDVLEVGLGYGTVSQRIAEVGAHYSGLDIAQGPVAMANHRLRQQNLSGEARQGSVLKAPFADSCFDYVVAIGCLHHTGNLAGALREAHRLLRPGGQLIMMVYYAYSYRRFVQARDVTLRYALRETFGYRGVVGLGQAAERAAYDANRTGEAAPHTDWISIRSLRRMGGMFSSFHANIENIDVERPFGPGRNRRQLLRTSWPAWFGLDLYATLAK